MDNVTNCAAHDDRDDDTPANMDVAMDVGSITRVKSDRMNDTVILYHSVRQVGLVYKFNLKSLLQI